MKLHRYKNVQCVNTIYSIEYVFIMMHCFYLSCALTGYIFAIYGNWPRYSSPGSWFMLRNGNCINTDFTEDTIKNDENDTFSALFRPFGRCFWLLQDKHNKHTLSENIKLACTCGKTGQKSSLEACFSTHF